MDNIRLNDLSMSSNVTVGLLEGDGHCLVFNSLLNLPPGLTARSNFGYMFQ